ncbi:phage/plasmid primase, P4 family [Actinomyces sp. HMT897]|uniref:phage/plasmid primase, P4 family n=1 Tax=Actinomyces sp. HMT897 TaxID=2789424 RepID=UPI00190A0664|nr:phage/plasmid primase, P4 family [Actinomyces sp. HMT897]QQO78149.1 bifunctional DNA primase/polymerase [Actinomyces sp. HMT897]
MTTTGHDTTPTTNSVLAAALTAHATGYSPIPIRPADTNGDKRPAVPWKPYQTTPATTDQIHTWFDQPGRYGLAVATGVGNLLMIELEGRATSHLADLTTTANNNGASALWTRVLTGWLESSPSGGIHVYVRTTSPTPGNEKLATRPATQEDHADGYQGRTVTLAETRGQGGYTVIAPTPGTFHHTGRPWTLLAGGPTTTPTLTDDELTTVLDLFRSLHTPTQPPTPPAPTPPAAGTKEGTTPGDSYEATTTWPQILTPHGWRIHHEDATTTYWTRPGKTTGISATTGHADDRDRLYVFTTSTDFQPETPYTKLGAYALLNHGGDMHAAARHLAHQGYGEPARMSTDTTVIDLPTRNTTQNNPDPETPHTPTATTLLHTDDANALLLARQHTTTLRHITDRGRWATWDGTRWRIQPTTGGLARELAKTTARNLPENNKTAQSHKKYSLSAKGITAMLTQAATIPDLTTTTDLLDANPDLLNTPDGTLNLRTGTLNPHDPQDLCTRITTTTPDPTHPTPMWDTFLTQTFGDTPQGHEVRDYVQTLLGYAATGHSNLHLLPFLHGAGANGKSVLLDVTTTLLGDYATTAPAAFLMAGRQDDSAIASLAGARLVVASEVNITDRFDEAKVKTLTGGDRITARYLYHDYFTFTPSHTIILMGNSQPRITQGGVSLWRRLRLIDFPNTVPADRRDPDLAHRIITQEAPGVLAWIATGARTALTQGITTPTSVEQATASYAVEEDHLTRFIADCLTVGGGDQTRAHSSQVIVAYRAWCANEGETPMSPQALGRELRTRTGTRTISSHGRRFYTGLTVTTPDPLDLTTI